MSDIAMSRVLQPRLITGTWGGRGHQRAVLQDDADESSMPSFTILVRVS